MLTCVPMGICSWNFRICDGPVIATLRLDDGVEQASLVHQDITYQITSDGIKIVNDVKQSTHWNLYRAGKRLSQATELGTRVEVFSDHLRFTLRRANMLTREFELSLPSGVICRFERAHPFTRRTFIECSDVVPLPLQLFAFSLVVFMWRRSKVELEAE